MTCGEEDNEIDSEEEATKEKTSRTAVKHKFENIGCHAYHNVLREYPEIVLDKEEDDLSRSALTDKGLSNYLDAIEDNLLNCRCMYGFVKKRSSGKLKFF